MTGKVIIIPRPYYKKKKSNKNGLFATHKKSKTVDMF